MQQPGDDDRTAARAVAEIAPGARVIGVGEGAHFVQEFNQLRAEVVDILMQQHHATHLALEIGDDEAPKVQAWLHDPGRTPTSLHHAVGPLTGALYGTFLAEVAARLGPRCALLNVLGVDLPNSLTLEASLAPLTEVLAGVDADGAALADDARMRAAHVRGGSAAASAFAWMALPEADRDAIGVALWQIVARAKALQPLYRSRSSVETAQLVMRWADAAATTGQMLRAMADLFSGQGREAATSLREHFVAQRILAELAALPAGSTVVYVAHNNHVQKTPVSFDGSLVALPAGLYLHDALAERYVALGLTHLDRSVPEMDVTGTGPLGFTVVRAPVEPPTPTSVEAAAAADDRGGPILALTARHLDATHAAPDTIRSQSSVTHAPLGEAFDAVLVTRTATTDPTIEHLDR